MDHIKSEIIGFYRLLVVGHHHKQLQSYVYPDSITKEGNLYYYKQKKNKTLMLFLNGGTQFNTGRNIEKIISHLVNDADYDIAAYINETTYNLLCVRDICEHILRLDYEEIIIVGLSVGTIISSHVAHKLYKKGFTNVKLICIDPITNMYEGGKRTFDHNYIHRPDLLQHYPEGFFNARKKFNCGYSEFFGLTSIDKYVAFLAKHYDMSPAKYRRLITFNLDIPKCHVHWIHTLRDPVVIFDENHYQYKLIKRNKTCIIHNYYLDEISHCTMIQSNPELQMEALNNCIHKCIRDTSRKYDI